MDAQMQEETKGEYGQDTFSGESEASSGLEEGSKLLAERENDKVSGGSEKSKAVSPDASVTDIPLDGDTNHTSGVEANSVQGSADEVPDSVEDTVTKTVPSTTGKPPADSGSVGSGTGTSTEPAHADGWAKSGGATYYYEGGERVTGEKRVGDSWYYFDPARGGAMAADEFVLLDDADVNLDARDAALRGKKWVYYGEDGAMCYGERNVGGSWYYLAPDSGAVSYGFVYIAKPGTGPAKWVYYGETMGDGKMRYGEQNVGGSWYYLAPGSGAVSYGFVLLPDGALDGGRKWVYYGPYMGDGKMRKGEQYIDGGWYYLIPATGEVDYEWSYIPGKGKWVYYGPYMGDGRMRYGQQKIDGKWYYLDTATGRRYSTQECINRVLGVARSKIGTPDSQTWRWQIQVRDAGGDYCYQGPCMSFVWACFREAGMSGFLADGLCSGWPHHFCDWFRSHGKLDMNPTPGSVVFWQFGGWSSNVSCGHAEIVISSTRNTVTTLGVIAGGTQIRVYSKNGIVGYGHPF